MANGPSCTKTGSKSGYGITSKGIWMSESAVAPLPISGSMPGLAAARPDGHCQADRCSEANMTQTSNRFFDEMARLMNDAAGVAQGVRREFDTLFRTQAERILRDLDVVQREEFEAVKEMARLAREENETLKARIAALEAKAEKPTKKAKDSKAD